MFWSQLYSLLAAWALDADATMMFVNLSSIEIHLWSVKWNEAREEVKLKHTENWEIFSISIKSDGHETNKKQLNSFKY